MTTWTVPYLAVDPTPNANVDFKRRWIKPPPGAGFELRFEGGNPANLYWLHVATGAQEPVEAYEGALP